MAMPLAKPVRLGTFHAGLWLVLLACLIITVMLPQNSYIRYQAMSGTIFERVRWAYERIHFDDTPIDIAFIGSSRTARGVISPELEDHLTELGFDVNIANFSLPAAGFDVRLALAQELLAEKQPDFLVISVVEQFPRHGHQAFGDLATVGELLRSPWVVNRNLPENLVRLPMRQIQLAMASWMPEAFGYRAEFDPAAYAGTSVDPRIFNPGRKGGPKTAEEIAALKRESRFRRGNITKPILPNTLAWLEFRIPRTYLRRLAEISAANGTQIVFLYLPFYGGFPEPFERNWLEQYGPVLSAEFLREDPNFYNDVAHSSELGATRITDWLAVALFSILKQPRE